MSRATRREAGRLEKQRQAERKRRHMALFNTDTMTIGDDWYKVRELSVPELQDADEKGTERAAVLMRLLPEEVVKEELRRQRDEGGMQTRAPRYEAYNPATLLRYGLVEWSHDEPCDAENVMRLGAMRGEILARRIFELSTMPLGEVVRSSTKSQMGESQDGRDEHIDSAVLADGLPSETTTERQPVS